MAFANWLCYSYNVHTNPSLLEKQGCRTKKNRYMHYTLPFPLRTTSGARNSSPPTTGTTLRPHLDICLLDCITGDSLRLGCQARCRKMFSASSEFLISRSLEEGLKPRMAIILLRYMQYRTTAGKPRVVELMHWWNIKQLKYRLNRPYMSSANTYRIFQCGQAR